MTDRIIQKRTKLYSLGKRDEVHLLKNLENLNPFQEATLRKVADNQYMGLDALIGYVQLLRDSASTFRSYLKINMDEYSMVTKEAISHIRSNWIAHAEKLEEIAEQLNNEIRELD